MRSGSLYNNIIIPLFVCERKTKGEEDDLHARGVIPF